MSWQRYGLFGTSPNGRHEKKMGVGVLRAESFIFVMCGRHNHLTRCAPDALPGMRGRFARINGKLQDGRVWLLLWSPKKEGRCCVPL